MKLLLTTLLLLVTVATSLAQDKLILQHQKRKRKQKEFPMEKAFSYKINDSTYHYGKVAGFNSESITLITRDSVTVDVAISDIQLITRDRVTNNRFMEPFAYFLLGAGMTVAITPILWIAEGGDKALEGLEFAGILTAVSLPPLWYGSRQERYNLQKKWVLKVE